MRQRISVVKPFRGRTILVVEDHEDSLNVSRLILEAHGARVVCATDGHEALRALEIEQPDLILCDLRMPVMDGYAFIARLRRNPRLARLCVIAVTALGEYSDLLQTWAAGFDGHLAKPVDDYVIRSPRSVFPVQVRVA